MKTYNFILKIWGLGLFVFSGHGAWDSSAQTPVRMTSIAEGWARNSVNTVIFRRNSVVTHDDSQYVAFYDADGKVVLAKRKLGADDWVIRKTQYRGDVRDAHKSISLMADGDGFLHLSWNQHNNPLLYCRSVAPESLELTEAPPMTGSKERRVSYPEFYRLPGGNLLFLYRDGASGQGNLMMNVYDLNTRTWSRLQDGLIDGEGERNAYWQACVDARGAIQLSWVWRESGDVATNHDLCYAQSTDGGKTWQKSTGGKYQLPITVDTAEIARRIPQRSELINQTSMCADSRGRPYIATYWRPQGTTVPQYFLVYHDGAQWRTSQVSQRTTPFSLSGGGTKRIPISRPQIVEEKHDGIDRAYVIFRDADRGNRVSLAICDDLRTPEWRFQDLTTESVGLWEPTFDTELWTREKTLNLFVQKVGQGDGETLEALPPQPVSILEWKPK